MDNPSVILNTVDRRLDHAVDLILYGRAALWLGFNAAPPEAAKTQDVDAIISIAQAQELSGDSQFWDSVEAANGELAGQGLYITHLFSERDVFLRCDWRQNVVPIARLSLRHLKLFRPSTIDLVLTKMMRGNDPQDMADAKFMIEHDKITKKQLEEAFSVMNPIELLELRDAFAKARPIVTGFAAA